SELIQMPGGHAMLVDGGRQVAGETVLNALRQRGVQQLDWVLGTHPHEDHIGGLIHILDTIPARQILDSGFRTRSQIQVRYLGLIKQKGYPFALAEAGTTLDPEPGIHLEFLTPPKPALHNTVSD